MLWRASRRILREIKKEEPHFCFHASFKCCAAPRRRFILATWRRFSSRLANQIQQISFRGDVHELFSPVLGSVSNFERTHLYKHERMCKGRRAQPNGETPSPRSLMYEVLLRSHFSLGLLRRFLVWCRAKATKETICFLVAGAESKEKQIIPLPLLSLVYLRLLVPLPSSSLAIIPLSSTQFIERCETLKLLPGKVSTL